MPLFSLDAFPCVAFDKLRYADADPQGHVNNAVFSTFLETGRVEMMYHAGLPLLTAGASFVVASLKLDFVKEITWPGKVDIGTGVRKLGNSSMTLYQQLFQNGTCTATAETVIVQVDGATGKGKPLSPRAKETLASWLLPGW